MGLLAFFFPCFVVFFASKLAIFPLKRSVLGAWKGHFRPEKDKWWIWGSKTPKPPEMPIKLGKTSQHHNWPRYMDWPQIGPKIAIKQGKKTPKGQMVPISRAHRHKWQQRATLLPPHPKVGLAQWRLPIARLHASLGSPSSLPLKKSTSEIASGHLYPSAFPSCGIGQYSDLFWTRVWCIPGFGAENKSALFQDFLLISAVLRVRGRFQNPRQTPVRTNLRLKRFPKYHYTQKGCQTKLYCFWINCGYSCSAMTEQNCFWILNQSLGYRWPSTGVKSLLPGKLRKKSEKGLPGALGPRVNTPPKKKSKTSRKRAKNPKKNLKNSHFWLFFAPFLTPGPRGPGNPFSDFFGSFPGEGLLTPVDGQRYPKSVLEIIESSITTESLCLPYRIFKGIFVGNFGGGSTEPKLLGINLVSTGRATFQSSSRTLTARESNGPLTLCISGRASEPKWSEH